MADTWSMPAGSRDHWPEDYERGRPGWPRGVVDVSGLPPPAVLELGAGTGKLTRLLVAAFDRVVAVEPADAMCRLLVALCPDAEALAGTAQEIPLAAASVDAVFAAEAFHTFDGEGALAEIARVLRPRGVLVLMWNPPGRANRAVDRCGERLLSERGPKAHEVSYDPLDLRGPSYRFREWGLAFAESLFEPLHEARLPNPQTIDRDGLVAFFASMGWIADLADDDRLPLLDQARSLLTAAEYRRPLETLVHWTRLAAAPGDPEPGDSPWDTADRDS